jgi:glutathione synthase/RimK-type ligase-like ATP-grasp enzyme
VEDGKREGPVLVLTHSDDTHADRVHAELTTLGVPAIRWNTDIWPPEVSVSIRPGQRAICDLELPSKGRIPLSQIRSIWYRRIVDPALPDALPAAELQLLVSERQEALNAVIGLFEGFILCNPFDYRRIDNKILQTQAAILAGLEVPTTILTSSPAMAAQFIDRFPSTVYKLQRSMYLPRANDLHTVYTTRVTQDVRDRLAHVSVAPCLFQEEIRKEFELRITVVGAQAFACRMDSQASPDTLLDYRKYDFERVAHDPYELPGDFRDMCVAFVRELGLYFASMDFVKSPDGRFVFLDLNPNGQYLWTEELAGLKISRAIATLLSTPPDAK